METIEVTGQSDSRFYAQFANCRPAGCKIECPICEKRVMAQAFADLHKGGFGQHVQEKHPEAYAALVWRGNDIAREDKAAVKARAKEAIELPLRDVTMKGELVDEIIGQLRSLIDMMEPYYSQGNADRCANDLIKRLEDMMLPPVLS